MCEGSKERRLLRRKKQVEGREMRRKNLRHVSIPTPVIVEGTATPTARFVEVWRFGNHYPIYVDLPRPRRRLSPFRSFVKELYTKHPVPIEPPRFSRYRT